MTTINRAKRLLLVVVAVQLFFQLATTAFVSPRTNCLRHRQLSTQIMGVLSRSAILSAANRQKNQQKYPSKREEPLTVWLVAGVLKEARYRQNNILDSLAKELTKPLPCNDESTGPNIQEEDLQRNKHRQKVTRERIEEVRKVLSRIDQLENALEQSNLLSTRNALAEMGFGKLFSNTEFWKWNRANNGSPSDFGGLVFHSPLGVPILVSKSQRHGDSTLRRIAQGSDLWFQVQDYQGSRVLLRSSLCRGTKDSKECRAMAADLAAYFSDSRQHETVSVMYTDSRHVAKRGSKAGQMRQKKALGKLSGKPERVSQLVGGQEP